jgi:hypothetical protein
VLDFLLLNATKHKWLQPGRENPNLKVTKDQLHKEISEAEEEDGKKKVHIYCRVYTYPHHSELTAQHPGQQQQQQAAIALPLSAAHYISCNGIIQKLRNLQQCHHLPIPHHWQVPEFACPINLPILS